MPGPSGPSDGLGRDPPPRRSRLRPEAPGSGSGESPVGALIGPPSLRVGEEQGLKRRERGRALASSLVAKFGLDRESRGRGRSSGPRGAQRRRSLRFCSSHPCTPVRVSGARHLHHPAATPVVPPPLNPCVACRAVFYDPGSGVLRSQGGGGRRCEGGPPCPPGARAGVPGTGSLPPSLPPWFAFQPFSPHAWGPGVEPSGPRRRGAPRPRVRRAPPRSRRAQRCRAGVGAGPGRRSGALAGWARPGPGWRRLSAVESSFLASIRGTRADH